MGVLFLQRILPIALLVLAGTAVPYLVWSESGLPRLEKLRAERQRVQERASVFGEEIRRLRAEVERIKSDPSYVERTARESLGLVRQTEIVFQFDPRH